jgi:hypothetical protein
MSIDNQSFIGSQVSDEEHEMQQLSEIPPAPDAIGQAPLEEEVKNSKKSEKLSAI